MLPKFFPHKKFNLFLILTCTLGLLKAQEPGAPPVQIPALGTFTLTLSHDNAFGLIPAAYGTYPIRTNLDFSFYGLLWTNPGYAGLDGSSDFWLESGVGVSKTWNEGKYVLNPSLGFTHGRLLSGTERGSLFDGMVPNLAFYYTGTKWEVEGYASQYIAFSRKNKTANHYFLGWVYAGYRFNSFFSSGIHAEEFYNFQNSEGIPNNLYSWVGAYLKFTIDEHYYFRFSGGKNLENSPFYGEDYYRLSIFARLK